MESRHDHYFRHLVDFGNILPERATDFVEYSICGEMMKIKAVIDRFEGNKAVLSVGDENRQMVVLRKSLPKGIREGVWLQVEIAGDQIVSAIIDEEETARMKERIAEKLERLRRGDQLN
jgi:hypothetical protein